MLAPATGFYATKGKGMNEVRISYVLNVEDLRGSMKCLENTLVTNTPLLHQRSIL